MKKYGLPYMGSKSKLADRILDLLPSAECFVDLFAGGMAMSHAALLSPKFNRVISNDISDIPQVFVNAVNGVYKDESRWISREDFFRLKDSDPYVRLVWSFSNNMRDYLYGRHVEPFKKALHWAVYYRDPEPLKQFGIDVSPVMEVEDRYKRWLAIKHICRENGGGERADLQSFTRQRIHRERWRQGFSPMPHRTLSAGEPTWLRWNANHAPTKSENGFSDSLSQTREQRGRLDIRSLSVQQGDYRKVEIPDGAVVYCDAPYKNTTPYGNKQIVFDYDEYYDWLRSRQFPVWISEYNMPDDFVCVAQFQHWASNSGTKGYNNIPTIEKIFLHEKWVKKNNNGTTSDI